MFLDEKGAEQLEFTDEEIEFLRLVTIDVNCLSNSQCSPEKMGRTKPEAGRFADKQWVEMKEKQKAAREAKRV